MTTNINFYGKPFGAPLLPNKITSDGWSVADARHIGGHRVVDVVDDLYELYDWQLINPSALLNNDTASAVGQKWYVKGNGTYMLKDYSKHDTAAGWVKVEDVNGNVLDPSDSKTIISKIQSAGGDITGIVGRVDAVEKKFGAEANKAGNPIVLDTNGYITSSLSGATFKKINGVSILKSASDKNDITIDLSLFIVPSDNKLPTADINPNKIYLIKKDGTPTGNIYIEYMYVNSAWEQLGEYKSEVDLTPYLKKSDAESTYLTINQWNLIKGNVVQKDSDSPEMYILESKTSIGLADAEVTNKAASVAYAYTAGQNVLNSVNTTLTGYSKTSHTHTVTINGNTKTLGTTTVDLGTYLVSDDLTSYTYDKKSLDTMIGNVSTKVDNITYSSTVTSTDTKAPTGAAVYTFVSGYTYTKPQVDAKINGITASSLGVTALTNDEVDTLWTGIFG